MRKPPVKPKLDESCEAITVTDDADLRYRAIDLFGPRREIEIALGDAIYRLRWTRSDKLILNK